MNFEHKGHLVYSKGEAWKKIKWIPKIIVVLTRGEKKIKWIPKILVVVTRTDSVFYNKANHMWLQHKQESVRKGW